MTSRSSLFRYRVVIALLFGLLGPTVGGVLLAAGGMNQPEHLQALTKLVVWFVGLWALGTGGAELYYGWRRYRTKER